MDDLIDELVRTLTLIEFLEFGPLGDELSDLGMRYLDEARAATDAATSESHRRSSACIVEIWEDVFSRSMDFNLSEQASEIGETALRQKADDLTARLINVANQDRESIVRRIHARRCRTTLVLGDDVANAIATRLQGGVEFASHDAQPISRIARRFTPERLAALRNGLPRFLGGVMMIFTIADIVGASSAYARPKFSSRWLSRLAYAISRHNESEVNVELRMVIDHFSRPVKENSSIPYLGEGFAYFTDAFFTELLFEQVAQLGRTKRIRLAQAIRGLIANKPPPTAAPLRRTRVRRKQIVRPEPRPIRFPEQTIAELQDRIYLTRLTRSKWIQRLHRARSALRQLRFDDRFGENFGQYDYSDVRSAIDEVALCSYKIRSLGDRIALFLISVDDPIRKQGQLHSYDRIRVAAVSPLPDTRKLIRLQQRLTRRLAELDKRDGQLKRAGREEIGHINRLRKMIDKLTDEIKALKVRIEFLERLQKADTRTDEHLLSSQEIADLAQDDPTVLTWGLARAFRQGIDAATVSKHYGIDLAGESALSTLMYHDDLYGPTVDTNNAEDFNHAGLTQARSTGQRPFEGTIYEGALLHDDLYQQIRGLRGRPANGDQVVRFDDRDAAWEQSGNCRVKPVVQK